MKGEAGPPPVEEAEVARPRDSRTSALGPDVRVALRRDLGRAAIWTRPRAEGRNLLVATTTFSRGRARSPPGTGRPATVQTRHDQGRRCRHIVALRQLSCGSRRCCARISCSGRSASGGCLLGPGRDIERAPRTGSLGSRQARRQSPAGTSLVWTPWGDLLRIARIWGAGCPDFIPIA